jgi:hypothetical protein
MLEIGVKSKPKAIIQTQKLHCLAPRAWLTSGILSDNPNINNINPVCNTEKLSICKVCFLL